MSSAGSVRKRVAAMCENCSTVFASELWADGTIRPIGTKRCCPCGAADFRLLS